MDERQDPSGSSSASGSAEGQPHHPRDAFVEKEHMFDKVVTPSDVGKLNRLVIPKQHAEKYFPLNASSNEKGLLLCFEDRTGKPWRFRYSYWNSSQSYVMTKGWSRFVKEKRLDAGDTVSFGRGLGEAGRGRFFIDWKRRPEALDPPRLLRLPLPCHTYLQYHHHDPSSMLSFARSTIPWSHLVAPPPPPSTATTVYGAQQSRVSYGGYNNLPPAAATSNPYLYLRSAALPSQMAVQVGVGGRSSGSYGGGVGGGGSLPPTVFDSVTGAASGPTTAAKRVRLFGVNLDCSTSESDLQAEAAGVAAYGNSRLPALPSPVQLSLGSADTFESPRKGKQPISLDLEM